MQVQRREPNDHNRAEFRPIAPGRLREGGAPTRGSHDTRSECWNPCPRRRRKLIHGAASRVKIENLFFRTQYGLRVINPSMRPVLPWLAILDERIRARLEELVPEVFFEGGDPSQLPLSTRRNILRKTCEHLAQPAHSWRRLTLRPCSASHKTTSQMTSRSCWCCIAPTTTSSGFC